MHLHRSPLPRAHTQKPEQIRLSGLFVTSLFISTSAYPRSCYCSKSTTIGLSFSRYMYNINGKYERGQLQRSTQGCFRRYSLFSDTESSNWCKNDTHFQHYLDNDLGAKYRAATQHPHARQGEHEPSLASSQGVIYGQSIRTLLPRHRSHSLPSIFT